MDTNEKLLDIKSPPEELEEYSLSEDEAIKRLNEYIEYIDRM